MKTKEIFISTLILVIIMVGCNKKQPVGQWGDIIELSGKEFIFKSGGDSVLITAKGSWFGLSFVALDTNKLNIYSAGTDSCNFVYNDTNVSITSQNCNSLFIKMNANNTNTDRTLRIALSAGDYAEGIKIIQKK